MAYCSVADARGWVAFGDSADDAQLAAALSAAERAIDRHCGQRFELDAVASARVFPVVCSDYVDIGVHRSVIGDTDGMLVEVDDADDGSYSTSWSAADWYAEPLNGIGPDGRTGWPITRLRSVGERYFPLGTRRPAVRITAKWGWASTPEPVALACRMLAVGWHHRRATIAGQGGFENFFASTLNDDPTVQDLLAPYRFGTAIVGIA